MVGLNWKDVRKCNRRIILLHFLNFRFMAIVNFKISSYQ
jgi:hypothetical protein